MPTSTSHLQSVSKCLVARELVNYQLSPYYANAAGNRNKQMLQIESARAAFHTAAETRIQIESRLQAQINTICIHSVRHLVARPSSAAQSAARKFKRSEKREWCGVRASRRHHHKFTIRHVVNMIARA